MPTKLQTYTQIAQDTAKQLTSTHADWTSFLKTAARLYKYPYHEQLMIYAQRPEATACAEYDFWNERMGRYVRRGSKGIALIDLTGEQPKLRYVFDVSDTGIRERSRSVNLWEYKPEHERAVTEMLKAQYDVSSDNSFAVQLECVAAQLADEYCNAYSRDILDIVDDSFLYGYDDFNVGVAFRNAATVSITYSLLSRCGLEPDSYLDKEDFMSIFDWNTPEAVAELGTAVSVINQEVLRQIERTVKQYEREKLEERTDNHDRNILHEEGRLSSPEHDAIRTANEPRQVRQDENEVFTGTQTGTVQPPYSLGEADGTSLGDREVGSGEAGADRELHETAVRSDGSSESLRPDEMGGTDELYSSDSGRNDPERAGLRIEDYPTGEQLSLFDISIPSQDEQIAYIDSADSVKSQSAFSVSMQSEYIDSIPSPEAIRKPDEQISSLYEDYLSVKENHPDDVVLYQVGDFFEMFGEDAKTAAEKLTLHLTTRTLSDGTKTEMCGIPAYVLEENVEKLREEYSVSISAIDKSSGERRVYSLAAISSAQVVQNEEKPPEITTYTDNFRIAEETDLPSGFSPKSKFRMNMEAIKLLKELESAGRRATREEQSVLSKYVGWGGLADAFDEAKENWANEYTELKSILSPEEYSAARASTLNAHYTSLTVIKAIYEAVENMGFKTGNILEPSMGVGNFFGLLPESMRDSKLYGVELDSISGRIAKQLYPKADITVTGFETTDRRDFFDLAVGNVPFGNYKVNDRAYNKLGFSIHDYFVAKALDQVRSGGVIAFVTSRYTMDKQSPEVRRYIAQRAELLGAIRLLNNAFKANAGTEVVSDIIFLQKRDRPIEIEPDWVHLGQTENGQVINSYFADNPDMMLGIPSLEHTQYGKEDFTLNPIPDKDLSELLHEAVKNIGGEYKETELYELGEDEAVSKTIHADPNVKNYSYTVVDGEVYFRENSVMVKPELNATALERVKGLVELRDCVHELIDLQLDEYAKDEDIRVKQDELNSLYDSFSDKYGLISDRGNRLAFSDDSSYYLLCSLEILNDEGELDRKADMFTRRTIRQQRSVEHVETAAEALAVSIGERAEVDLEFMSKLSGLSEDELVRDLHGVIFADPIKNEWQTADEYLSGNVRQKLREAKAAVSDDSAFEINVSALTQAQPKDLEASDIEVRLGATWISKDYIRQFMLETFKPPIYLYGSMQVHYSSFTAEWQVEGKNLVPYGDVAARKTFGTDRANAYKILEETLNLRDMRIYDTIEDADGRERRVLNQKETTLAAQKQQAIKDAFKDWLWKDPERRQTLVKQYNEEMNSTRPREYDGRHITFAGMNPEISLREHQKNAVAHILYGGNTLLAHEVGAGKTFEMAAACMESKRLGLSQKSLFVVPNHLTGQWASEFLRLYPSANILVATKKDFETANRKKFCARIATGDYDAVIIGHSQFERIPISKERQQKILEAEIEDVTAGIAEVKSSRGERFTIKQLEKTKKGLEARLEKLQADHKKDDVATFEQLGVDRMFVDESHNYKNLFLYTKMRNVAGLTTTDAQKSSDMFAKCRYLDEITGNRGVIFATGTPISNSMTELYTIQRYLQYDRLQQLGMGHFDCWASRFGETTTALELAPEGTGYRARTRFAKFYNLPELMNIYKEVADVKTSDQLNLPVPEAEFHNVVAHPTEHQKELVQQLSERASAVHSKAVDPSVDNMLKITSDGRKLGLDQRIINPNLPDEPASKVNLCVNNIMDIWRNGQENKLTQLVFCDISTPKANTPIPEKVAAKSEPGALDPEAEVKPLAADSDFTVYDDIRKKLVDRGMPPEQIAFIHEANTDVKKKELFAKVRSGQVRVLIGSTFKMGAGTNVQDRLIALHDLDAPWRPGDLERAPVKAI